MSSRKKDRRLDQKGYQRKLKTLEHQVQNLQFRCETLRQEKRAMADEFYRLINETIESRVQELKAQLAV